MGLAVAVGEQLGLSVEQRRNLEFGALLHDVGKIAIPKPILNKPGKLDRDEWTIVKSHTIEGQKMLERVGGFMREVGLIVRSHHERWDGGGYPDGTAGEEIPLEARIIETSESPASFPGLAEDSAPAAEPAEPRARSPFATDPLVRPVLS